MTRVKYTNKEMINDESTDSKPQELGIGLISTWNQSCGLATYAQYLFSNIPEYQLGRITVFSEEHSQDEVEAESSLKPKVVRCWSRSQPQDLSQLKRAVEDSNLDILHFNIHPSFFEKNALKEFLESVKSRGIRIVSQLHNLFTVDPTLRELVEKSDAVVVHSEENKLEAIANGADTKKVHVIAHGVHTTPPLSIEESRLTKSKLGLSQDRAIITSFGFLQPHKGVEAVLEAVLHLRSKGIKSYGVIVGSERADDPGSRAYASELKKLVEQHGLNESISFVSRYVSDKEVGQYLCVSDIVVMNYRSQHFEASGACSLAVGAGAVVMTSLAPQMMAFGGAVWHMTSGYPAGLSAELLLTNEALRNSIKSAAAEYSQKNSWSVVSKAILQIYKNILETPPIFTTVERTVKSEKNVTTKRHCLKVLIQNRAQTFTHRGGDTVVIERIKSGLEKKGHSVMIDLAGTARVDDFDIVHLFNFATSDLIKVRADAAKAAGVPYVVTTLCEDLPSFHYQSHLVANRLAEYYNHAQDAAWLESNPVDLNSCPRAPKFENEWTARNASMLFTNGKSETEVVLRDYPALNNVREVRLGYEVGPVQSSDLFEKTYGVKEFVFCVGRFESRKNQLMLLKALEHSDLTVVLASGGFSYQPEYDRAVRGFKRVGKTIILDRISAEMLGSAYAACKIHVLPSWFELPGLVSLEAAAYGKNVVVTRNGTAQDYFGTTAFYASPSDEDSILNSVNAAFYAPLKAGLKEKVMACTWERCVDETVAGYQAALGITEDTLEPAKTFKDEKNQSAEYQAEQIQTGWYDGNSSVNEFQDAIERGELAAKSMDFELAHELLAKAEAIDPRSTRALKARGAVFLAESRVAEARSFFERALAMSPNDSKVLSGRGMCDMYEQNPQDAVGYFRRALEIAPDYLVALHQMVDCAYRLESFQELEGALRKYLNLNPEDVEFRFCLAGCLYKLERLGDASEELDDILSNKPDHQGSMELKAQIELLKTKFNESEQKVVQSITNDSLETVVTQSQVTSTVIDSIPERISVESTLDNLAGKVSAWRIGASEPEGVEALPDAAVDRQETAPPSPRSFGGELDVRFAEIEEAKRDRQYEEAQKQVEELLRRPLLTDEQRARAQSLQADLMAIDGDVVAAEALYLAILRTLPTYARALCGLGAIAAERLDWKEARKLFEQARRSEPRYDVAIAGLGICEMSENRAENAIELFLEAVRMNPENNRAILGVIQLGYPLKRFEAIEFAVREYLELHPANIDMLYSLAGVLFAQGKLKDARGSVETILLFEPSNVRAIELREMIAEKSTEPTAPLMTVRESFVGAQTVRL